MASGLTNESFLPQAIKIISAKITGSISLSMYTLFGLGTLL